MRVQPALLLTGVIGFALRGGLVLLLVPILVLPTSVEVRLLLGDNLGTSGLTSGFFISVGALSVATLALAVVVLYTLARCELAAFSRYVNLASASEVHVWPSPGRLAPDHRSSALSKLFIVQALALLAILVAAIPLASALGQATLNEILAPSSADSIYTRILNDVSATLAGWLVAIVLIEGVSAVAARRLLAGAFGLNGHFRMVRKPLRALAVWVVGWVLFIGAVAVSIAALTLAWDFVRRVFLATGLSGGLQELISGVLAALVFGIVFAGTLLLCGIVSSVRAGLWTLASLR